MSNFRLEHDRKGVGEILKSAGLAEVTESHAEEMAKRANSLYKGYAKDGESRGDDFEIKQNKSDRIRYKVQANSTHANHSNLEHNILLKAMGG